MDIFILNITVFFICSKIKVLIFDRNKIFKLDYLCDLLNSNNSWDPLKMTSSNAEMLINQNRAKKTKCVIFLYEIISNVCGIFGGFVPIINKISGEPMSHWVTFKVNQSNSWLICIWYFGLFIYTCAINCTTDCIFMDFIEHGCAKIKILSLHLQTMSKIIKLRRKKNIKNQDITTIEKKILRDLFMQHQLIYKIGLLLSHSNLAQILTFESRPK